MKHYLISAMLAFCGAAQAQAAGCDLAGGEVVPEIEALNQQILDKDFAGFAQSVETMAGMNVKGAMEAIAKAHDQGFDGCTTLIQRRDAGGMVQEVVMFHGKAGPLFAYWRTATIKGGFALLSFNLSGTLDVMEGLH